MPKYFKTFWECIKGDTYGILWVSQNQYLGTTLGPRYYRNKEVL